jgi:thiol-disulfide isomerase/thioredoxin
MQLKKTLAFCAVLFVSSWSHALTLAPYSAAVFTKLQTAGEAVTLHFRADWCPTCRAQDKALESLKADPDLKLTILRVDYDKETELKKQLNVRSQSTFVVYRGKVETARQIGATAPDAIRKTLSTSL